MRDGFGFITVGHLRSSVNKHGCYFSYLHLLQKKKNHLSIRSKKMKGHENGVQVSSSKLKTLHCYHRAQTSGMRKLVKFRQPRANFRRLVTS